MRNVSHELIGVSAVPAASRVAELGTTETAVAAVAAFQGSWLPDGDQLGGRIHRRTRLERRSIVVRTLGALIRLPLLAFGALTQHRALTHSALATAVVAIAVGLAVALVAPDYAALVGAGVGVGYGAHVFADACTPAGVWLWWPFGPQRVWLLPGWSRIRTSSVREALLAVVVVVATVALMLA